MSELLRRKELKVSLPTTTYLRVVRLKVLRGVPIGVTVEEALRFYFERAEQERAPLAMRLEEAERQAAAQDGLASVQQP